MKTSIYHLESTKQVLLTQIAYRHIRCMPSSSLPTDDRHWYQENDVPVFPVQDPKCHPAIVCAANPDPHGSRPLAKMVGAVLWRVKSIPCEG